MRPVEPCTLTLQAVPDTKLTLKKYSDSKFEFLVRTDTHLKYCRYYNTLLSLSFSTPPPPVRQAYCLKVKELDDEEYEATVSLHTIFSSVLNSMLGNV